MEDKKIKKHTLAWAALAILAGLVIIFAIMIYGFGVSNFVTQKISAWLPMPAAIASKAGVVTINELENDLSSIRMFYENQDFSESGIRVDFSTADGQKRLLIKKKNLLNKMIETKIIEFLAKEQGIGITDSTISDAVEEKISEYDERDGFEARIKNLYGWNLAKFEEKIVKPEMYRDALEAKIRSGEVENTAARKKIEAALSELKNGTSFEDVAKKYSEGKSAENSGDVGWFTHDQMLPEIAEAALNLKEGETSDVISSSIGFHVIKVEGRTGSGKNEKLKIRQIFIRTKNFADWLLEQEKKMRIIVLVKGFYWDKEAGVVKFKDESMRNFEDNLYKNFSNDTSILF